MWERLQSHCIIRFSHTAEDHKNIRYSSRCYSMSALESRLTVLKGTYCLQMFPWIINEKCTGRGDRDLDSTYIVFLGLFKQQRCPPWCWKLSESPNHFSAQPLEYLRKKRAAGLASHLTAQWAWKFWSKWTFLRLLLSAMLQLKKWHHWRVTSKL